MVVVVGEDTVARVRRRISAEMQIGELRRLLLDGNECLDGEAPIAGVLAVARVGEPPAKHSFVVQRHRERAR